MCVSVFYFVACMNKLRLFKLHQKYTKKKKEKQEKKYTISERHYNVHMYMCGQ